MYVGVSFYEIFFGNFSKNIKFDSAIIKRFDPEKTEINALISPVEYGERSNPSPDVPLPAESGTLASTGSMGQELIIQMDQPMSNMSSESEFESDLGGTVTNSNDESQYPAIGKLEVSDLFPPEAIFESSQLGRKLKRTFENVAGQKRTRYEKRDLECALKVLIEESDFDGIVDLFERISSQATDEETLTQHLNRAKCFKYFHSKKFEDLYKLVDAFVFEREHHSELQVIFFRKLICDSSKKLTIQNRYNIFHTIFRNYGMKHGIKTSKFD